MVELVRSIPAPPGLGVALAGVPEGADLVVDMRLESVVEGVLVTGTIRAEVVGECARCLDPLSWAEEVPFTELFAYPPTDARGRVLADRPEDDEEALPLVEDDLVDLEATVRDAVVTRLPLAPLCREDCPGLCPTCGVRLADEPGHGHEATDPRWEALRGLAGGSDEDPGAAPGGGTGR